MYKELKEEHFYSNSTGTCKDPHDAEVVYGAAVPNKQSALRLPPALPSIIVPAPPKERRSQLQYIIMGTMQGSASSRSTVGFTEVSVFRHALP